MKRISDEVYYVEEVEASITREDISFLKSIALKNPSNKARICAHKSTDSIIHEMFIAQTLKTSPIIHKHLKSTESFQIIDGVILIRVYSEDGKKSHEVELNSESSTGSIFFKIPINTFHSVQIVSPIAVYKETKQGPFLIHDSIFPDWD